MSDKITIACPRPESGDYAYLPSNITLSEAETGPILPLLRLIVANRPPESASEDTTATD